MKRTTKRLLLAGKIILAVALLALVVNKAHWNDYVVDAQGDSYPVLERLGEPQSPMVRVGTGWGESQVRPLSDFEPVAPGEPTIIRRGSASALRQARPAYLVLSAALFLLSVLTVALRWWLLLRLQRIRIRPWETVRLTFVGLFYNTFVPGTVGGDLVKAYYVAKHTDKRPALLVSIFVDRLLGLAELTLLAAVMLAIVLAARIEPWNRVATPTISTAVIVLIVVGMMMFLLSQRFRRLLRLQKIYGRLPIAHHIAAAGDAARLYRRRLPQLGQAIAITIGAHILFVGAIWMIGLGLGIDRIPWHSYFVYVPLIYIIGALPITPGGAGLVEHLYVSYFVGSAAGVSPSLVLTMALLARVIPILVSLPGAVVAVTGARLPKPEAIQRELGVEVR